MAYSVTLALWVIVELCVRRGGGDGDGSTQAVTAAPVLAPSILRTASAPSLNASPGSGSGTEKVYRFETDDLRIALFFLFFVQVGFFGTGK